MTKFPTFVDEVLEMNKSQRLWPSAKELVTNLHLKLSSANNELIQQLMVAQYQIAKVNRKIAWMKELRMHASLHQSDAWLIENLDYRPRHNQKVTGGVTITKDIRLQMDTSLPIKVEDASHRSSAEVEVPIKVESAERNIQNVNQDQGGGSECPTNVNTEKSYEQQQLIPVKMESESVVVISDEEETAYVPGDTFSVTKHASALEPLLVTANLAPETTASESRTVRASRRELRERSVRSKRYHQEVKSRDPVRDRSGSCHRELGSDDEVIDLGRSRVFTNTKLQEQEGHIADIKSKRIKTGSRVKYCPVPDCTDAPARNARRHVMERHFPIHFRSQQLEDLQLHKERIGDVEYLQQVLLRPGSTLSDLVNWVNRQKMIPDDAFVPETDEKWLSATCQIAHWRIPHKYSLHPVNSRALLFHWRVLVVMLNHVSEKLRLEFRNGEWNEDEQNTSVSYTTMDSVGFEDDQLNIQTTSQHPVRSKNLPAWDSHFHLDRSSHKIFGHQDASLQEVIRAGVGVKPNFSVDVEGGVLVYCDPEHYPARVPKEKGFGVAIGVHPKKVAFFQNDQYGKLRDYLRLREVVGLGEIGLDHTEPESTWKEQEDIFIKVLQLSMPIRPLIIHLRDPKDKHCGELSTRCLQIMKANVAPTQKIHLHCFGGTVEQVVSWMEAFPRCYFGFTGSVNRFDDFQKSALRKVPRSHLLETDSPYFMPSGALANTPAFIGDVATAVARIRREAVEDILDLTAANIRVLYML